MICWWKTIFITKNVDTPVAIGNKHVVTLKTDIVPNEILLLLSKKAMKTANMTLGFQKDSAAILRVSE